MNELTTINYTGDKDSITSVHSNYSKFAEKANALVIICNLNIVKNNIAKDNKNTNKQRHAAGSLLKEGSLANNIQVELNPIQMRIRKHKMQFLDWQTQSAFFPQRIAKRRIISGLSHSAWISVTVKKDEHESARVFSKNDCEVQHKP